MQVLELWMAELIERYYSVLSAGTKMVFAGLKKKSERKGNCIVNWTMYGKGSVSSPRILQNALIIKLDCSLRTLSFICADRWNPLPQNCTHVLPPLLLERHVPKFIQSIGHRRSYM